MPAMQPLRPLSEDECYMRLYRRDGKSAVNVVRFEPAQPQIGQASAESLRRLLDLAPDEHEDSGAEEAA